MIKIVSGWSNPGGSTIAHIALCNLFNKNGMDCTFYGPHDWHLDKCKSGRLREGVDLRGDDVLISHFIDLSTGGVWKHIYSCHETDIAPIRNLKFKKYDLIHYVSESQRAWHDVDHKSVVIPNVIESLHKSPLNTKTAGIIGSIDSHKQTYTSIERALKDGWEQILIFGCITNKEYFLDFILPLLHKHNNIRLLNHVDDKQKMYDSIDCVYHSSVRETFNYVKAECSMTGVEYRGLDSAESNAEYWDDNKILNAWKEVL